MKHVRGWLFGSIFLVCSGGAFAQKTTLDTYVRGHLQALAEGSPIVYLEGERLALKEPSLANFKRKVVLSGSLKAVVPIEMVEIDDSFSKEPDLYDGLDARSKVTYFLSILTDKQLDLAASTGVGFGDLTSDQKRVLNSIIPKKVQIERREADKASSDSVNKFSLTDEERSKMRFKVTKSLMMDLPLLDNSGAFCQGDSMDHTGTRNLSGFFMVKDDMESGADSVFGIKIRSIVPNKLKKSELDSHQSSLNKSIQFTNSVTLLEVFGEIRRLTGVMITPDPRVANRKLTSLGGPVNVSDLLPAIAQMVTGTYRRVGSEFVLTSDLTGLGSRKLKFDQWEADVRYYVNTLTPEWRAAIAKKNVTSRVKVSAQDVIQPSKQLEEFMAKQDQDGQRDKLPDDLVEQGIREYIQKFNTEYRTQNVSTKGISVRSNIRFNLVLPSGQDVLDPNGTLGPASMFQPQPVRPKPDYSKLPLTKKISDSANVGLCLRANKVEELRPLLQQAHEIGFKEIWLDTRSSGLLETAIADAKSYGMKIRLAVRPWLSAGQSSDFNLLGEAPSAIAAWQAVNKRQLNFMRENDFLRTRLLPENSYSPDRQPESWTAVADLTKKPGLSGIVVLDAQPAGYEQSSGQGYSFGTSPSDLGANFLGYSLSMRLEFLHKFGVDPIDLVPKGLFSNVNVNPFFFADMELMGYPRTYGGSEGDELTIEPYFEKWNSFRSETMKRSLQNLSQTLLKNVTIPIWSDVLVKSRNKAVSHFIPMLDYSKTGEFSFDPSGPGTPFGAGVDNVRSSRFVFDKLDNSQLEFSVRVLSTMLTAPSDSVLCYDLSRMSQTEAAKFLNTWFEPTK